MAVAGASRLKRRDDKERNCGGWPAIPPSLSLLLRGPAVEREMGVAVEREMGVADKWEGSAGESNITK